MEAPVPTQDVQPTKRKAESILPKVPLKTKPRPPDNPRTKAISKLKTRTYKIWECLDDAGAMTDVDDLAGLREVLKRWKITTTTDNYYHCYHISFRCLSVLLIVHINIQEHLHRASAPV